MQRPNPPDNEHQALLDAYRDGERMPPQLRDAAWQRIQRELPDEPAPLPRQVDHRRDWAWMAVLLAAAVLLIIFGGRKQLREAGDAEHSQAEHDAAGADPRRVQSIDSPAPSPPTAASPIEPPASEPPVDPPVQRPRPQPRPAQSSLPAAEPAVPTERPGIDVELALLATARAALAAGTPAEALPHLAEHARRFPGGDLTEERLRLEIEARCALGQRAEARATAEAFAAAFPRSPHLKAITALCAD